jgi:hypothetical protein
MLAFPYLLRFVVASQKVATRSAIEFLVQNYYFAFLFLHLFLNVSISSGLTAVVYQLVSNVRSISTLLAQNLPKASNYFLSYLLLQSFFVGAITLS